MTDAQLAAAVEENLFAFFRAIASMPGGELFESDRLSYHDSFPPAAMFKGAWNTHLAPGQVDEAIEQTLARFQLRGAPLLTWWYSDRTQPPNLCERLAAHGFELDYVAPGMAFDLDSLDETLSLPDGLTIVEARDERTLADWGTALYGAYRDYEMPASAAQAWVDGSLAFGAGRAPWQLYVGYWHGQPVATNLLFNADGVSGLYCVGTTGEVRGKGIGTSIILKPLLDARAAGCHHAVLFSSEMAVPIYAHLGFREVGIQIGRCVWWNG